MSDNGIPVTPRRGVPNTLAVLMMVAGLGGTGYGYTQSNVTHEEAERNDAQRNRYEDQIQHCQERIDALLEKVGAK